MALVSTSGDGCAPACIGTEIVSDRVKTAPRSFHLQQLLCSLENMI